jgi:hypothetical protein
LVGAYDTPGKTRSLGQPGWGGELGRAPAALLLSEESPEVMKMSRGEGAASRRGAQPAVRMWVPVTLTFHVSLKIRRKLVRSSVKFIESRLTPAGLVSFLFAHVNPSI